MENEKIEKVEISNGPKMRVKLKGLETMYITDNPRKVELKEELLIQGIEVVEAGNKGSFAMLESMLSMAIIGGVFYIVYKRSNKMNGSSEMGFQAKALGEGIVENFGFHQVAEIGRAHV